MILAAYLAAPGLTAPLAEEATRRGIAITTWHDRLALSPDPPVQMAWAQDTWLDPRGMPLAEAPAALAALAPRWAAFAPSHAAAAEHLASALPPARAPRQAFPSPLPPPSGAFTLLDETRVLASPARARRFVEGRARFAETAAPPSRAYLKLWEALSLFEAHPGPGDLCYDLGAAPGGWTWVCAQLGARVVAFDRAPLAPSVAAMLGVRHRAESAFGVDPAREPRIDWLVCDVIAYPPRTLALVRRWIASGRAARIVATVKFQGPTDHDTAEALAAIEGGALVHLSHNRHELTFLWPAPAGLWPNSTGETAA